ncbi:MAG: MdtA/MuxA family multidrug efflux RND transporter periplasmic adaptor subunit [Desulfarculus sp.]|nr:MdtA/MuxA family multidrug efflux RND transporter periplasmic adaptor subunit [Desulfarculus sp.]
MSSVAGPEKDQGRPGGAQNRRRWLGVGALCLLVAAGAYLFVVNAQSATEKNGKARSLPPAMVTTAPARLGDLPVHLDALGTVTPLQTVTVKSRVDGQLMEVRFQEGQEVKRGQLLARIDPRPYEVQLTQAQGQMARDQALLHNARLDAKRYRELADQDLIPRQQSDTQEALVRQYEGAVKTDQGLIDNARLQLTYCEITAPVDGRVGLRLVDPGNMIRASDAGGLVVITQIRPISVVFAIPEDDLPRVLARFRAQERPAVAIYDREQRRKLAEGELLTVDNQIDTSTGTVKLKARFANDGHELFPNQFVNVRLLVETIAGAVTVPTPAIQRGPRGPFVWVVKDDQSVTLRLVKIGPGGGGQTVIGEGLAPSEMVVIDGAERLREGAKVEVRAAGDGSGPRPGK